MSSRPTFRPLCLVACMAIVISILSARPSSARPNYKKCFDVVFKEIAKTNKTNCNVCHGGGDDKKSLNHFGEALAKELGEKNVKDEAKIIAAIKAVVKRKCKTGSWEERLEKGQVPCECSDANSDSYIARQLHRAEH